MENHVEDHVDNPVDNYDMVVVAGDEPYWLSKCLYDLAQDVGIPSPHFYGKKMYEEYNGSEKWEITTLILGRIVDPFDEDLEYTNSYPDFDCSVGVAMQGAIARICNKYRAHITHGSVFRLFGERDVVGNVIDRSHQQLTPTRHHFMEREFVASNMEVLMKKQIAVIDIQRERIATLERTVLKIGDHKDKLVGKAQDKDALILATQAQCAYYATEYNQIDQVRKERNKLQKDVDELQKKLAQMTVVQQEQKAPAEEEEEDPEEVESWHSSDEDPDTEESPAESSYLPNKRMKATQYFKLFKTQA